MSKEQTALERIKDEIAATRQYPDWDSMFPDMYAYEVNELIPYIIERLKDKIKADVSKAVEYYHNSGQMAVLEESEILKLIDSIK